MPKLALTAPHWAQRRAAYEAESRGEDPTQHIQTAPGGVPGRIRGVSALQAMASRQAYRARTSLPQRRSQATVAARPATPPTSSEQPTTDLATQQFENRRKQLVQGGISAPEAVRAATDEYRAGPHFVGPQNTAPKLVGPRNVTPGKDQRTIAKIREAAKTRPKVRY